MIQRAYVPIGLTMLLGLACVGPTGPAPRNVAGVSFEVIAVGSVPMPAVVQIQGRPACSATTVVRSQLAFGVDGTFEHRFWYSAEPGAPSSRFVTSYTQGRDGRIHLGANAGTGGLWGDTLRMIIKPELVCMTSRWTAVAR